MPKFRIRFNSAILHVLIGLLVVPLVLLTSRAAAQSPTLTTLYSFQGGNDGAGPLAGVVMGGKGVLYGTTAGGGPSLSGTVFRLAPPAAPGGAWTESVLYPFNGNSDRGPSVAPLLIGRNGALYGTTISFNGAVFQLAPPAVAGGPWTLTVLHAFQAGPDGSGPVGGVVVGPQGALFGVTADGGPACPGVGCGTMFQLTPPTAPGGTWTETIPYVFLSPRPSSALVRASNAVLYGTQSPLSGNGTVYKLAPPSQLGGTWTHRSLYNVGLTLPQGVIMGPGGVLYGTTQQGGISSPSSCAEPGRGCGTVYQLTPPAAPGASWTQTVLHEFGEGSDGATPVGPLLVDPATGVLYGATALGGAYRNCVGGNYACGTIFQLTPPSTPGGAWTETVLYSFTGGADGSAPNGGLIIGPGGVLYGTTSDNSTVGQGTVFQLTP